MEVLRDEEKANKKSDDEETNTAPEKEDEEEDKEKESSDEEEEYTPWIGDDPKTLTDEQLEEFQKRYSYLFKRRPGYTGKMGLPHSYYFQNAFDGIKRNELKDTLDPEGNVWPFHWKSKENDVKKVQIVKVIYQDWKKFIFTLLIQRLTMRIVISD